MEEMDGNGTEGSLLAPEELSKRMVRFLHEYYLVDVWRDRKSYYALTPNDLKAYPACICGLYVVLIMAEELEKAGGLLQLFDENHYFRMGMELVFPMVTIKRFIEIIDLLKEMNRPMKSVQITAGRPSFINGVLDYTRFGPFLERKKELFIEDMKFLYDGAIAKVAYDLALSEWYYQQNRLMDAGILVTHTIKDFDNDQQRRLLFVALYLQTKILFASGKVSKPAGYIRNIRRFVRTAGELEFSYNINAAEAYTALYEGNFDIISQWLASDAPDEFSEFCMLDLYRYMVKLRCYIVNRKHMAVLALVERLRPLLVEGCRIMDLCELDLLLAISFFRSDEKELAFSTLERVFKTVKRRGYYRLVADEGPAMLPILMAYIKEKGKSPLLVQLVEMARDMAALYPLYLRPFNRKEVSLTRMELNVLKFLEQGKDIEEISNFYIISEPTTKFHLKNIYKKLGVKNAPQAVWEARVLKLI